MDELKQKVKKCYCIPDDVLDAYEMDPSQCTDEDLANLSLMVALKDLGFSSVQRCVYLGADDQKRLEMLETCRKGLLEEVHDCERRISKLDVLRHQLKEKGSVKE